MYHLHDLPIYKKINDKDITKVKRVNSTMKLVCSMICENKIKSILIGVLHAETRSWLQ